MKLERFPGNPILSPHPDHPWEDLAVFNPAAWYDADRGEVLLLYRAAESHPDYKCYFGLATSRDGYHFDACRRSAGARVRACEGFDGATIQDPRIIKMGDWYLRHLRLPSLSVRAVLDSRGQTALRDARLPGRVPALPADQRHAHRTGDDEGLPDLDPRRLADRSAAGRSRRDPVSREDRWQICHDPSAAGMGRSAVRHRGGLRVDLAGRRPARLSRRHPVDCSSRTSIRGRSTSWA